MTITDVARLGCIARTKFQKKGDYSMKKCWHIFVVSFGFLALSGCASDVTSINRAEPLGLQIDPAALPPIPPLPPAPAAADGYNRQYRDRFVEQWMARSDILCRLYKDKLMMVSRDTRFGANVTQIILSGLGSLVTPLSTAHALAGAATIVGGVGAEVDSDFFQKQSGEIIASAIQTARENQANQIETNLKKQPEDYNIYRAQRDVADYHNMCSLETGLAQVRAALKATSPDAGATPPAAQGDQSNPVKTALAAEASDKAALGAAAGAETARAKGASPAVGAALGAIAAARSGGGAQNAAAAGAAAGAVAVPSAGPRVSAKSFTAEQTAFMAAVRGLKFDAAHHLTSEGRQVLNMCSQAFFPANTLVGDIRDKAGANLSAITKCVNEHR